MTNLERVITNSSETMNKIERETKHSKTRPIIGVIVDLEEDNKGYYRYPWYALRRHYSDSIEECGGTPILLPYSSQNPIIRQYIDIIDGLMITGGGFDIDPGMYGEQNLYPDDMSFRPERTAFEKVMLLMAIEKKMPILGICGGMQLINVVFGGTLFQHLPGQRKSDVRHSRDDHRDNQSSTTSLSHNKLPEHEISVDSHSKLYRIVQSAKYRANTSHHQAVNRAGKDLHINAIAPDGLIEGIESQILPFVVGVQWHPEYQHQRIETSFMHS